MPPVWDTTFTTTFHNTSYPSISPTRPELSTTGKTVLISGGGRGVGVSIVNAFAEAGAAHIFILGRNAANLQAVAQRTESTHPATKVVPVAGDVTREADVAHAFAELKKIVSNVDVVVANAGYLATVAPIPAATQSEDDPVTADWWHGFEVNVKGVFLLARQFLAAAAPNAVFLNVTATAGQIAPVLPGFSSYASSKIASSRVVETLQAENPALRFVNVHPGVLKTDMLADSGLIESHDLPVDDGECLFPFHFTRQ